MTALRAALLVVACVVAALTVGSGGAAGGGCPSVPSPHAARLTIKALKIFDRPIRTGTCGLKYGTIWDPFYPARPGDGETMVIAGHDVTPVWGYDTHGQHGPFYHLNKIKPGYMMKIKWHGVVRHYRFNTRPFARRQCRSKWLNDKPARLAGKLLCVENNKPIKNFRGKEVVYLRCCWPRYTRKDFLYERAVLVEPKTQR